jgi:hypothetical protein
MAWRDDSRSLRREAERVIVDQFDGLMPVERRGRFRAYFWRASGEVPGQLMTQSVISGLPIDAMQKDHSITVFALAAGLKGPPKRGFALGFLPCELRPFRAHWIVDIGGLGCARATFTPIYLNDHSTLGKTFRSVARPIRLVPCASVQIRHSLYSISTVRLT